MATKVKERLGNDPDTNAAGIIIDTYAWSDETDLEMLLHCQREFAVDIILVMDDRLYSSMKPSLENSSVVVVKLPRSGGVVQQDTATRLRRRKSQIDEYFYGKKDSEEESRKLTPHRKEFKFKSVTGSRGSIDLWRLGQLQLRETLTSHGSILRPDPLQFLKIVPSTELLHSVIAVLHPSPRAVASSGTSEAGDLDGKPTGYVVSGFLYVVQVQPDGIIALAPNPNELPCTDIVVGSIKWFE